MEPRAELGRGLAYSATDPDHRLNAPLDVHWIDPERPFELRQWCEARDIFQKDAECRTANGQVFLRRSDLGEYLADQIQRHVDGRSSTSVRHVRATATSARHEGGAYRIQTDSQGELIGDLLVIATGNPVPSLRPPFRAEDRFDERIIANPLAPGALDWIPAAARVLIVGSGLTALDVASTLVRRAHQGGILIVSRRGLRPRSQSPGTLNEAPRRIELSTEVPEFIRDQPTRIAAWTRALRKQIELQVSAGQHWYQPFDAVRDVVWKLWPQLATREKLRFLRRLRVFYDVHRFRTPPMNEAIVADAERRGLVRYAAATLKTVTTSPSSVTVRLLDERARSEKAVAFDCVVNCTGLDHGSARDSNPFLRSLLQQGLLRPHATGYGFDVTEHCEAIDASGAARPTLRVLGPPTAGVFGDPVAIPFIANQVSRILPDVLRTLDLLSVHHGGAEEHGSRLLVAVLVVLSLTSTGP